MINRPLIGAYCGPVETMWKVKLSPLYQLFLRNKKMENPVWGGWIILVLHYLCLVDVMYDSTSVSLDGPWDINNATQYSIYCFLTVGFPAFGDPDFSLQCFSFFPWGNLVVYLGQHVKLGQVNVVWAYTLVLFIMFSYIKVGVASLSLHYLVMIISQALVCPQGRRLM